MTTNNSAKGFSLIEVTVGVAILSIIIFMAASVVSPLMKLRNHVDSVAGLNMASAFLRECIKNDQAWLATVMDPANDSMRCLREHTACDPVAIVPPASYIKMKASVDPDDNCLPSFDTKPTALNTTGLNKAGEPCTGFSSTGNDQCPFRYNVYWTATCANGETRCVNPVIRVNADMVTGTNDNRNRATMDLNRYAIRAVRGRADVTRQFTLYETTPAGTYPGNGLCKPSGIYRRFQFGNKIDPGNYVRGATPTSGAILLEPGIYSCQISVPAYLAGSHMARLVDFKTKRVLINGTSEYSPDIRGFTQTRSMIYGSFTLTSPTNVAVAQYCNSRTIDPVASHLAMGRPMNLGIEIFSIMQCTVLSRTVE